ncbi:TetR/AcrR family transcriptional regulator [Streptomyces sp. B1866]|uniref:TetR/AcrR family transcriptional regulator n=1 Tax=Streptomyces sp. B1866 TaxID=3075431 RepID=UPI002891BF5C|nr:TetR/AcrR family transcriptional regulator [Streptomyces sp. B1866]MDT3397670.1 TetR/AcrR family transcriptional regulator [Streptomyces sp. B1866]
MASRNSSSGADGRATRWAGQHERRRAEFVDAALAAITAIGPEVSTEQIAAYAGVARPRLYKHFSGADDLYRAIAQRAVEQLTAELGPVWNPEGSPLEMLGTAIGTYVSWLADHRNLYRYVIRHSLTGTSGESDAITDLRTAIGEHTARLFADYLVAFELDPRTSEPLAFGLVGFVEAAVGRWLEQPAGLSRGDLTDYLARWLWRTLDDTLSEGGVRLDPHQPLPAPEDVGRSGYAREEAGPEAAAPAAAGPGGGAAAEPVPGLVEASLNGTGTRGRVSGE